MKNLKRTGLIALLTAVSSLLLAAPALAQTETTSSDAAGATVGIIMMLCGLLIMVIFLAIYIWVAVWIYKDASKRDTSAALWVIMWIFFSWVGLVVYLIVRPKEMTGGTMSGTPPPPPPAATETPPPPPAATETPPPPPSEPGASE